MTVRKLLWDDWNIEHIWNHKVITDEVEQVCKSKCFITRSREGKYRVVGQTDNGRYLMIVGIFKENGFYIITARDADKNEIKQYKRK